MSDTIYEWHNLRYVSISLYICIAEEDSKMNWNVQNKTLFIDKIFVTFIILRSCIW